MDSVDRIIAYESGELPDDEMIELFQELIDSGEIWRLQGHYGRQAQALIMAGYCMDARGTCPHLEFTENEMDGTAVCEYCGARREVPGGGWAGDQSF